MLFRWLTLAGVLACAGLAAAALTAAGNGRSDVREGTMIMPEKQTRPAPAIVPLDTAAPAKTETATFALG